MSSSPADGSEDVNDFLQRIKELGDRRDQEDEERNRKLEEEILQGKRERQARRAERARSISPTKSSPANTPTASRQSVIKSSSLSQAHPPTFDPQKSLKPRRNTAFDAMDPLASSILPAKEKHSSTIENERDFADSSLKQVSSMEASPSSTMPLRNSPLSWQRRPTSRASDRPRSRPLSMVATENAARSPRATPEPSPASAAEPSLTRDQIAQSLASKDPAWFRQSAESRGGSSPAYRKNQVEDEDRAEHGSSAARVQMPGMSREYSKPEQPTEDPVIRTSSSSRSGAGPEFGARNSGIGSPVPLTSSQRFDPPNMDVISETRGLAMSPSQGRISPERLDKPASPTKGMGGFVQSAMMKRSDSVSKRWSVQSPPGLNRGNSIASNRSSVDPSTPLALSIITNSSGGGSRPSSLSRDSSPRSPSRPTSSHSNATVTQDGRPGTGNSLKSSITTSTNNDGFVKPGLPASRSQTPQDIKTRQEYSHKEADQSNQTETTPPTSPSKTMDPRRWSPTKSSWLESALNKPESPKPKPNPPAQQPAWMSEISKTKQKGSVDLGRSPTNAPKHEVNIGGLMRLPPLGGFAKPVSIGGLPAGYSSGTSTNSRSESISSQSTKPSLPREELPETVNLPPTAIKSSPTSTKVKPETPPKKDFKANLKPRQIPVDSGKEEPEFKNVFGQLRRTKTQNYVAPDELKSNITRGKAALNATGGPKKTERKDEFKDAILKKKEDFKKAQTEGKGVTRSASGGSQDSSLPEALAKRKLLSRSDSSDGVKCTPADPPSVEHSIREPLRPSLHSKGNNAPGRLEGKEAVGGKLAGRFNPVLAGLLARGPPSMASDTSRSSSSASSQRTVNMSTSTTAADASESGPQLTHMTKGRARGPRRKAPSTAPVADRMVFQDTVENPLPQKITPEPKNPNPSALSTNFSSAAGSQEPNDTKTTIPKKEPLLSPKLPTPLKMPNIIGSVQETLPQPDSENPISQPSSPRKLDLKRRSKFLQEATNNANKGEPQLDSPKPLSPTKKTGPIELPGRAVESVRNVTALPITNAKPKTLVEIPSLTSSTSERPSTGSIVESPETANLRPSPLSPNKVSTTESTISPMVSEAAHPESNTTNESNYIESPTFKDQEPLMSVRDAASRWASPTPSQTAPPRTRSPIKLPTHDDEKAAMVGAGLRSASPEKQQAPVGLGLQIAKTVRDSPSSRPLPTPPPKSVVSPPPTVGLIASGLSTKSNNAPVSQTSEATRLVADFFEQHSYPPEYIADTTAILVARPDEGSSIKTLRSTLYQFSEDGKKQPVPISQERLLFESNMYICIHVFGNSAGKKVTEVYLWSGDAVSVSTVAGTEIFAQREARGAGGTLVKIQQGKETPAFFQALGGIIVIRRGSSNKYDSLAPHILCGRKSFGQIAFDEVDYSASSLCSGFPYLISTQSGKSYLWKGKGSGIDELSCARLIGMDFGLTGEIEEVEDGNEPPSFLQIFDSSAKIPKSADHWNLKANYSKYCSRLFRAGSAVRSQIVELAPFNQTDLASSSIYVLDAFFEIYVIVGSRAQSQFVAFHNALIFAQEYGILAAGMEDRPYVPVTTVVFEGIPKDMKSVFRKWSDELTPTLIRSSSPLSRGRSLRFIPLNVALEATR